MTAMTERPQLSTPEQPVLLEPPTRRPRYLPGDPEDRERLARMIRVDQPASTAPSGSTTASSRSSAARRRQIIRQ